MLNPPGPSWRSSAKRKHARRQTRSIRRPRRGLSELSSRTFCIFPREFSSLRRPMPLSGSEHDPGQALGAFSFAKTRSNGNFKKSDGGRSGLGEAGGLGRKGRAWNRSPSEADELKVRQPQRNRVRNHELMTSSALNPPQKGCSKRYQVRGRWAGILRHVIEPSGKPNRQKKYRISDRDRYGRNRVDQQNLQFGDALEGMVITNESSRRARDRGREMKGVGRAQPVLGAQSRGAVGQRECHRHPGEMGIG
jgi:hypothetical protein